MRSTSNLAIRVLLTVPVLTVAATIGFSRTGYDVGALNPFMWWVLLGVVIIHLRVHPSWLDAAFAAGAGALFSAFAFGYLHLEPAFAPVCCYLGLGSWTVLGLRAIWACAESRARFGFLPAFVACCFFVGFLYLAAPILYYAEQMLPKTLDLYLVSFDGSLGFQPSFLAGKYYWGFAWLRRLGILAYSGLPVALALAYVENLRARREQSASVGLGIFYLGLFGMFAYALFPATGPVHVFGGLFPDHPLGMNEARALPLSPIPVKGSRNAMPSLHMAWILWCWWCVRGLKPWVKAVTLGFVVFTVFATLGTGEHYLSDLVVAFPFTLMMLAAFSLSLPWNNAERVKALLAGLGATALWFVLLRYGQPLFWISPAVPWALILGTLALVYWRKAHLIRAAEAGSPAALRTPPAL
jgi:hypothetical protein